LLELALVTSTTIINIFECILPTAARVASRPMVTEHCTEAKQVIVIP
jgi:hypothetical protein